MEGVIESSAVSAVEQRRVIVDPLGRVSRKELAKAYGRSPKTLCEWASKGIGPRPYLVGGRVFYNWSDAQDFAREKRHNLVHASRGSPRKNEANRDTRQGVRLAISALAGAEELFDTSTVRRAQVWGEALARSADAWRNIEQRRREGANGGRRG